MCAVLPFGINNDGIISGVSEAIITLQSYKILTMVIADHGMYTPGTVQWVRAVAMAGDGGYFIGDGKQCCVAVWRPDVGSVDVCVQV